MSNRSVWITGVGAATPLGRDFRTIGDHLLAGHSGATLVTDSHAAHAQQLPTCLTPEPPTPSGWDDAKFRSLARSDQFALWSAVVALEDAGWSAGAPRPRMGLALGSGGELLCRWETDWNAGGSEMIEGREQAPTLVWSLGERLGIDGPTSTIAAACASGNYAIAQARRWIELGLVDVCLAGGVEAITPMCRANFNNLRALSRRTVDVQRASRPFDNDRDGFVMGEGAAMFVLEAADHARRRGAARLCRSRRLWRVERCLPHDHSQQRLRSGCQAIRAALRRCWRRAAGSRLHQCPCHEHAGRRQGRSPGAARGLWNPRASRPGQLDEEHDRPSAQRRGRDRSAGLPGRHSSGKRSRRRSTSTIPIPSATCATCRIRRSSGP